MPKALLLVDIQKDFCEGGSLPVTGGNEVAKKTADYIYAQAQNYELILASKDWHSEAIGQHFVDFPPHCVSNTSGAEFNEEIEDIPIDDIFFKGETSAAFSAFEGTNNDGRSLDSYLTEHMIDELDICGLATDYCVKASVNTALSLGFKTSILVDLVAAVDPKQQSAILQDLSNLGARLVTIDAD